MLWRWVLVCVFAPLAWTRPMASRGDDAGAQPEDEESVVLLWGDRQPPDGEIFEFTPEGIVFEDPFGVHRTVRWDMVRLVRGPRAAEAREFMPMARLAWRARTRLERGDAVTAEPMFEQLYPRFEGLSGDTASMVAEGLLRCRLRRSAQTAAVRPWLAYLVSEANGPYRSRMTGVLRPAVDEQTGLVPSLAPVWLDTPAVQAFARSEPIVVWDQPGAATPRRAQLLGALYRQAARFACHESDVDVDLELTQRDLADEGVRLVHAMVAAQVGDQDERALARQTLRKMQSKARSDGSEAWIESWCRLGIGQSLLLETDKEQVRLGVVELLHLPARFGDSQPYLAGVALARAIVGLQSLGDDAGARSLLVELRDRYTTHPATSWDPIRSLLEQESSSAAN